MSDMNRQFTEEIQTASKHIGKKRLISRDREIKIETVQGVSALFSMIIKGINLFCARHYAKRSLNMNSTFGLCKNLEK